MFSNFVLVMNGFGYIEFWKTGALVCFGAYSGVDQKNHPFSWAKRNACLVPRNLAVM